VLPSLESNSKSNSIRGAASESTPSSGKKNGKEKVTHTMYGTIPAKRTIGNANLPSIIVRKSSDTTSALATPSMSRKTSVRSTKIKQAVAFFEGIEKTDRS